MLCQQSDSTLQKVEKRVCFFDKTEKLIFMTFSSEFILKDTRVKQILQFLKLVANIFKYKVDRFRAAVTITLGQF
mgnify:CR=1 FL=1